MSCCEASLVPDVENSPIPKGSSEDPPTGDLPFVLEKNGDEPNTSEDKPLLAFPLVPLVLLGWGRPLTADLLGGGANNGAAEGVTPLLTGKWFAVEEDNVGLDDATGAEYSSARGLKSSSISSSRSPSNLVPTDGEEGAAWFGIMKLFSPDRGGIAGGTWLKGDCSPLRAGGDDEELLLFKPFVEGDELKLRSRPTPLLLDELVFIPVLELKSEPLETVDVSHTLESDNEEDVLPEELSALLVDKCGTDKRSTIPFLCM